MYDEKTPWPLKCPDCLHEFEEKVGWLKTSSEIRCPACKVALQYEPKEFLRALNKARPGIYDLSQTYDHSRIRGYPRLKLRRQVQKIGG
jgi:DNA-directed RNA polymerase subunit RPC12/RpoP